MIGPMLWLLFAAYIVFVIVMTMNVHPKDVDDE